MKYACSKRLIFWHPLHPVRSYTLLYYTPSPPILCTQAPITEYQSPTLNINLNFRQVWTQ